MNFAPTGEDDVIMPVSHVYVMSRYQVRLEHPFVTMVEWRISATPLIARFMGPTWGPSGAYTTQAGPMLVPWTLLSGIAASGYHGDSSSLTTRAPSQYKDRLPQVWYVTHIRLRYQAINRANAYSLLLMVPWEQPWHLQLRYVIFF